MDSGNAPPELPSSPIIDKDVPADDEVTSSLELPTVEQAVHVQDMYKKTIRVTLHQLINFH